jgi:D-aminoacyl-tRNA deacylase
VVGFGGGHYAPRFERIARETDWAVGHVAADWGLKAMGAPAAARDLIAEAFERSAAAFAVVDGEHPALEAEIEALGYRVVSETWLRAVDGVALPVVERLETALEPVAAGLRFGADAGTASDTPDFETVTLPSELLGAAHGVDAERTRELVAAETVAFETAESGTRVAGRAAVADERRYEALIDGICVLLRREYETVERDGATVIATRTAFDPAKARDCGVPEGPKFGRLADGEAVRVSDETIEPEQVRSERTRRFSV